MRNHTPNTHQPALDTGSAREALLHHSRRGGAVIIVVLALLSLMIFLGVFFFEFVQEEQLAAGNYAANPWDVLNPDRYLDGGEKTVIVGPDLNRPMGALSAQGQGAYHSLLAHTIGGLRYGSNGQLQPTDVLPHSGHGITTTFIDNDFDGLYGPGDYALFDMNGDGLPDATLPGEDTNGNGTLDPGEDIIYVDGNLQPAFAINYSPPAQQNPNNDAFNQTLSLPPYQPDVEYTYPDVNNLFLAYDTIDSVTGRRILVPSFQRPDLFLSRRQSGDFSDLYTSTDTKRLVLRPHTGNLHPDGITYRFPNAAFQAQSGDTSRLIQPFPLTVDSDNDGILNEMGIYSSSTGGETGYDLDVDLTGDGQPDGIWIDHGHELVDLPDGRQFVPMFSYYILDGDGLLNINTAGNFEGVFENSPLPDRFSTFNSAPFSLSNQGTSASEINPLRVFTADPSLFTDPASLLYVQSEYAYTFGIDPTVAQPIGAMANMDWTHLAMGRSLSRSGSRLSGRGGEEQYVPQYYTGPAASFPVQPPRAGVSGVDDDTDNFPTLPTLPTKNRYQGGNQREQDIYDPRGGTLSNLLMPSASHPVAPRGTGAGAYLVTDTNPSPSIDTRGSMSTVADVAGTPVVWPQYSRGWEEPATPVIGPALPPVQSPYPYGGSKFSNGTTTMLDEEDEARVRNPDAIYDDLFTAEEILRFQASDADLQRVGGYSRAENLALMNLKYARDAAEIRRRLTTHSWDFSEISYVPGKYIGSFTETSEWSAGSGRRFFPPVFGTITPPTPPAFLDGTDPFRPEVRALFATEDTSSINPANTARRERYDFQAAYGTTPPGLQNQTPLWRQPLNLNKLLVGFDADGYPVLRDLIPHPDIVALEYRDTSATMPTINIPAMIHSHDPSVQPIPPTAEFANIIASPSSDAQRAQTATALEWWARYDRQRMARDIYTLLYLVGASNGEDPVTANPYSANPERVREIAQFAVNYVDALDRDDVITRFEYDDNLSDGWGNAPNRVVYGIERASLSFSEVQFLQTTPQMSDYTTTLHNEQHDLHQYLHMELRNSSPFTIDLNEGWRISRVATGTGTRDCSIKFQTKGGVGSTAFAARLVKQVAPGANFLIGTHDGTVRNAAAVPTICTSDFYADYTGSGLLESVLPSSTATIVNNQADPVPQTDLDLAVQGATATNHTGYYVHDGRDAASTYIVTNQHLVERIQPVTLGMAPYATPAPVKFDLVLERRQNVSGVEAASNVTSTSSMGEWIEVDRFSVDSEVMDTATDNAEFSPASPGLQANVQTALLTLNSVERRQPFDPVQVLHTATASINHTMSAVAASKHAANSAWTVLTPAQPTFTLWQPHFDRDFTSAYELLSVPLYGNWPLTELSLPAQTNDGYATNAFYKEIHGGTQFNLAPGSYTAAVPANSYSGQLSGDYTAGIRFKFPSGVPGRPYQGWNVFNYQNCWYRLFDFVTVPRRADQQSEELLNGTNNQAGSTKPVFRVPGKINLNTVRDETVLAALIDDEVHLNYLNQTNDNLTTTPLQRNWFQELLHARDGVDFFAGVGGVSIPNSIVSHPFRGASQVDPNWTATTDQSVQSGLLRSTLVRNGTQIDNRPAAVAYSTPVLTPPTNYATLWAGAIPHDTSSSNWQGLFDAGDLTNGKNIDHHTRDRILAKVANNSTNKSHVFFIWTAVGYFEAHRESAGGNVQVGARLTDIPIHRRFTVVDMTKLDDAYDTQTNTFDEKKFIIYQKRLR